MKRIDSFIKHKKKEKEKILLGGFVKITGFGVGGRGVLFFFR